jgi:hypothetical protein
MSKSTLKPDYPCRAKQPAACRYHGAFIRLDEAVENGDYDAYETAKLEVAAVQKKKRQYKKIEEQDSAENLDQIKAPGYQWLSGRASVVDSPYFRDLLRKQDSASFRFEGLEPTEDQQTYFDKANTLILRYEDESKNQETRNKPGRLDTVMKLTSALEYVKTGIQRGYSEEQFHSYLNKVKDRGRIDFDRQWGSLPAMSKFNGADDPNKNLKAIYTANAYNAASDLQHELLRKN